MPASVQAEMSQAETGLVAAVVAAPKPARATGVQPLVGDGVRTRFVIGLEKSVTFQVFSLSNPNRVVVELPEIRLQLPQIPEGHAVGLVKSIQSGLAAPGKTRIVIEVTQPVVVETATVEKAKDGKPPMLALQIVPVDTGSGQANSAERKPLKGQPPFALGGAGLVQPPMARPAKRPDLKLKNSYKPIIVLDPGHGGHDTGAQKNGAVEKEVVLAFAKVLREKLNKTGRYNILMTRDDDRFIELSERVDYAERNKAQLFIAIHADYTTRSSARGATIYSLREGTAESLKKSATREVSQNLLSSTELETVKKAGEASDVSAVQSFLADFAQREVNATKERTSIFSRAIVANMSETTAMRDDPDKSAGFRVLKTAQFPSVLIELAYVTNKEDAELLMSDKWRDHVSDSIMTAIDNYFSNQLAQLPM
ncbi:MAG: N-acetylmuramoyl-L-alanine amidase [Hyphomicrobium sp.]